MDSNAVRAALERVRDYMPPEEFFLSFASTHSCGLREARKAFQELKKFLAVSVAGEGERWVPAYPLDPIWHAFILDTPEYHKFCRQIEAPGGYIHHVPTYGVPADVERYRATRLAVVDAFGRQHKPYWPDPDSSSSSGDCAG